MKKTLVDSDIYNLDTIAVRHYSEWLRPRLFNDYLAQEEVGALMTR